MPHDLGTLNAKVVVLVAEPTTDVFARASALADQLGLPLIAHGEPVDSTVELIVAVNLERLELRENTRRRAHPLSVDFVTGNLDRRRRIGLAKDGLIARALGIRKGVSSIVDATAGFLADTFHMACLGCRVMAVERSPVMSILAADGIHRGWRSGVSNLTDVLGRIRLVQGDARSLLSGLPMSLRPDVVYLDPMYAGDSRTALARKELRLCRRLVGSDLDAAELLEIARTVAGQRVVVKRHPAARPLAEPVSVEFRGRTVRYDAYLPRR